MLAARDDPEKYSRAKAVGVMALALGLLLWLVGFEVIGGEYFLMWQSHTWNGQESAFRFACCACRDSCFRRSMNESRICGVLGFRRTVG
jgi:predicted small integral membrane protein